MSTEPADSARERLDPRRLIAEAFAMEGVSEPDCRSIFFDWALGLPEGAATPAAIEALLERHADAPEAHPMRRVLLEGLERAAPPRGRRGGRAGRVGGAGSAAGPEQGGEDGG